MDEVSEGFDRYAATLEAVSKVSKCPVTFNDDMPTDPNVYFRRGNLITIREGIPEGQTVKTVLHGLAHSRLHDGDPMGEGMHDRAMREVQAASVAYAVAATLGLDTSGYSFGYIASWAVGKTDEEMRQHLQIVRGAARDMLADLQEAMAA